MEASEATVSAHVALRGGAYSSRSATAGRGFALVPTARRGRPRTRERDPKTVRVELRLPQNVAGALYERAHLDDRTVTATVTRILEDALLDEGVTPSADLP